MDLLMEEVDGWMEGWLVSGDGFGGLIKGSVVYGEMFLKARSGEQIR